MKYYKDNQNNVYAYEADGSQDNFIGTKVAMTDAEVAEHLNPTLTLQQTQDKVIQDAIQYLKNTDYKMTVDYDKDTTEVKLLRQEARNTIRGVI